jgi:hypothetical protein
VQTSTIYNYCPTGFTAVTAANGRQLGCIETDLHKVSGSTNSTICQNAIRQCWNDYGARLPTYNESYLAHYYLTLTSENNDQWVDGAVFDYYNNRYLCSVMKSSSSGFAPSAQPYNDGSNYPNPYRCFIAR